MLKLILTGAAFCLFITSGDLFAGDLAERFKARIFKSQKYTSLPYRLQVPNNYHKTNRYPLILFLHGSDERGDDNIKQLYIGLNIFADEKRMDRYQCFIAAPQCPADMKWVDIDWKAEKHAMHVDPTPALAMAIELLDELQKEFSIDRRRLYLIGYSMGGFGTWEAIVRWPGMFAAAVPVCGGGDETKARLIRGTSIWAFHGALDNIVKVSRSRNMIDAVVKAGDMPRYTEYPTINHYSWGIAFSDPHLFEWLFRQKK
jgi:predicted peptidase